MSISTDDPVQGRSKSSCWMASSFSISLPFIKVLLTDVQYYLLDCRTPKIPVRWFMLLYMIYNQDRSDSLLSQFQSSFSWPQLAFEVLLFHESMMHDGQDFGGADCMFHIKASHVMLKNCFVVVQTHVNPRVMTVNFIEFGTKLIHRWTHYCVLYVAEWRVLKAIGPHHALPVMSLPWEYVCECSVASASTTRITTWVRHTHTHI